MGLMASCFLFCFRNIIIYSLSLKQAQQEYSTSFEGVNCLLMHPKARIIHTKIFTLERNTEYSTMIEVGVNMSTHG